MHSSPPRSSGVFGWGVDNLGDDYICLMLRVPVFPARRHGAALLGSRQADSRQLSAVSDETASPLTTTSRNRGFDRFATGSHSRHPTERTGPDREVFSQRDASSRRGDCVSVDFRIDCVSARARLWCFHHECCETASSVLGGRQEIWRNFPEETTSHLGINHSFESPHG